MKPNQPTKIIISLIFIAIFCLLLSQFGIKFLTDSIFSDFNIGLQTSYFKDSSGDLSFDEIRDNFQDQFIPSSNEYFRFGLTRNANWIKFKLEDILNHKELSGDLKLLFSYAAIGEIDLYLPLTNGEYKKLAGGINRGDNRADLGFLVPVFTVPAEINYFDEVFIRLQSPYTANFKLLLLTHEIINSIHSQLALFLGVVSGIIIAMILYNLVLYFSLKDRIYIWYILYVTLMLLYQSGITGTGRIINNTFGDFIITNALLFSFLAIITHLKFAWHFLNVLEKAKTMKWVFVGYYLLCWAGVIFFLSGQVFIANFLAFIASFFVSFVLITTVYISYRNQHHISKYYLLAVAAVFLSLIFFVLRALGVIMPHLYSSYYVITSVALESLLFSFALADRIRKLRQQHFDLIIKEKQLSKLAITDDLTGLFNRRYFNQMLDETAIIAQKEEQPLALILIDIDQFKIVNDTYGHPKGDQVLKKLAEVINRSIRSVDYAFRIGGEEFAVILPHTYIIGAREVAERIRQEYSKQKLFTKNNQWEQSTISLGVTQLALEESSSMFFKRADDLLYQAKNEGRNQTVAKL